MTDVVVGKSFKDHMCDAWAEWMLKECLKQGTTKVGNYKHPSYPDCLKWVVESWAKIEKKGIVKSAKRLGMRPEPGPVIPGYVNEHFQDLEPRGEMIEMNNPGSVANDLSPE